MMMKFKDEKYKILLVIIQSDTTNNSFCYKISLFFLSLHPEFYRTVGYDFKNGI